MTSNNSSITDSASTGEMWSTDLIVALVALIVSSVTLVFIVLQLFLQGLSLASGYSNCDEKVMGLWAKTRKIKFYRLRPEVHFDAPVIFIAPPDNTRAPVLEQKICVLNGSLGSYAETKIEAIEEKSLSLINATSKVDVECVAEHHGSNFDPIHTANSERATWLTLLSALQLMEYDSIKWQADQYKETGQFLAKWQNDPQKHDKSQVEAHVNPQAPITDGWGKRTLSVAIQSKTRSWSSVPDNVQKPYATTTFCHLVEMAAILGLYWREFNEDSDRYRAHGNGYVLSGAMHADFGLIFSFNKVGDTKFKENRLIPVDEIKELCFGYVPTMLREEAKICCLKWPQDAEKVPSIVHTLQLGSPQGFVETLASIGCSMNTQYFFSDPLKRRGHLFPVAFELIGMLAPPLHIKKTSFRMLPNPTFSNWDSKVLDLSGLFAAFKRYTLSSETTYGQRSYIDTVITYCDNIEEKWQKYQSESAYEFLDELHETIDKLDKFLFGGKFSIIEIVRRHVDHVMKKLNGDKNDRLLKLLDEGSPKLKVDALMQIYFEPIRKTGSGVTQEQGGEAQSQSDAWEATRSVLADQMPSASPSSIRSKDQVQPLDVLLADEIWYKLMLRMLCWLSLHDFNKRDVQLYKNPKSELLGSRLPVYII